MYFKNKISNIEHKVEVMYELIQKYAEEDKSRSLSPYNINHQTLSTHQICVSDDESDVEYDSEEVSDNEENNIVLSMKEKAPSSLNVTNDSINLFVENINVSEDESEAESGEESGEESEEESEEDGADEDESEEDGVDEDESIGVNMEESNDNEEDLEEENKEVANVHNNDEQINIFSEKTETQSPSNVKINLKKLRVTQLKNMAKEKGLSNYSSLKKKDLISLLNSSE
jgi:hypothetical protein